jgi:hypothetical protein
MRENLDGAAVSTEEVDIKTILDGARAVIGREMVVAITHARQQLRSAWDPAATATRLGLSVNGHGGHRGNAEATVRRELRVLIEAACRRVAVIDGHVDTVLSRLPDRDALWELAPELRHWCRIVIESLNGLEREIGTASDSEALRVRMETAVAELLDTRTRIARAIVGCFGDQRVPDVVDDAANGRPVMV